MVPRLLTALRELLFDPGTFFEERPLGLSLGHAAIVVCLVALVVTAAVGVVGWLFTQRVDATRTVTVAEPMPEELCEQFAEMDNESTNTSLGTPEGCALEEPRTRQVDVGDRIWEAFVGRLPLVFVGFVLGWLLVAGGLHLLANLGDPDGSFGRTLAIVGWAQVPGLLQTVVALGSFYLALQGTTIASDPGVAVEQLRGLTTTGVGLVGTVGAVVATLWQAYIWRHGLEHARRVDATTARAAAGILAAVVILFSLAG